MLGLNFETHPLIHGASYIAGLGLPTPIPIPNLNRLYFKFGTPVDTAEVKLDLSNDQECQGLYDHVKDAVNQVRNQVDRSWTAFIFG
jgi:hypothetical protein